MDRVVGIDLGTTFSAVAWVDPETGRADVLRDPDTQEATLPSVVMFEDETNIIVGRVAKDNAVAEPQKVAEFVKRQMGKPKGEPPDGFEFRVGNRVYSAQEISAIILKRLKTIAETRLDAPVDQAVITVPAYFDEPRRAATREAAEIAGIKVLDILDEPVAAALAYGLQKAQRDQTVFVFDLGGGTFDVTVLRIESGVVTELAIDGDAQLGGKDWDDRIIDHCARQFAKEFRANPLEDAENLAPYQELQQRAVRAKHELSRRAEVSITVNYAGHSKSIPLSQEEFEALCQDLVENCRDLSQRALEQAKLGWDQIDTVLLVGGSTRMPMIQRLVQEMSGKEPVHQINPDECVAQGAAWKAAIGLVQVDPNAKAVWADVNPQLAKSMQDYTVNRILSHPLGCVAHVAGPTSPLVSFLMLDKGAPLPAKHVEMFQTLFDGQLTVNFPVTQDGYYADGVKSERDACTELGTVRLGPLPQGAPAGTPIQITYEFSPDGVLHVSAVGPGGAEVQVDIEHQGGLSQGELGLARARNEEMTISS